MSHCRLLRQDGVSWTDLGIVLKGNPAFFDKDGHTPDVSVVYDAGKYHMIYDWGTENFNVDGGIAYASAVHPEGPWIRDLSPITHNIELKPLIGRYKRTYAATLIKRRNDWMIVGMMDRAPWGWALFAMTAPKPQGPYAISAAIAQGLSEAHWSAFARRDYKAVTALGGRLGWRKLFLKEHGRTLVAKLFSRDGNRPK